MILKNLCNFAISNLKTYGYENENLVSLFVFAMIGSLLSCKSNDGQPVNEQNDDVALRQFVSERKEQAYQLIGKDSVAQGLDILISLWQEHHVDGMIPCGIGSAYYCMGDRDSAYYWFQVAEAYYDSMMVASPSEKYLRDKLPLAYILRGAEAAKEVEM